LWLPDFFDPLVNLEKTTMEIPMLVTVSFYDFRMGKCSVNASRAGCVHCQVKITWGYAARDCKTCLLLDLMYPVQPALLLQI
jgi:hypothetical protein